MYNVYSEEGTGINNSFIHGSRTIRKNTRGCQTYPKEMSELSIRIIPRQIGIYEQVQYKQEKLVFTHCHCSRLSLRRRAFSLVPLLYVRGTAG